ncbi:FAD/NAD-P-binding domain-containing protein [Auriscalpium vulgare]|uniref:FAD/NAD-P-binding domain-containing protein n=1 Tax=Auriscalpium vulgare TaxID=40419 RepID=A0ACB8S4P2_9AGAM|nr:FAD/NAD-P-binding domain-containing protein [Auriscalpium vulgare]
MPSRALVAAQDTLRVYSHDLLAAVKTFNILYLINPWPTLCLGLDLAYIAIQLVIIALFKPKPPKSGKLKKPYGRIAVVGAGLTGVSSAAHAIAHNFEVVIFEANKDVGGIWANVNKTSSLQLNSLLYRFHPALLWSRAFPYRDEILSEIRRIWKEYKLESRTHLNSPVTSIRRADNTQSPGAKWVVNDGADGVFDAVIVTVGTCGKPMMIGLPGMPKQHENKPQHNGNSTSNGDATSTDKPIDPRDEDTPSYAQVASQEPTPIERHQKETHVGDATSTDKPIDPRDEDTPSYAQVASQEPTPIEPHQKETHVADDDKSDDDKPSDEETYQGTVLHSSELDDADLEGKTVLVVGSGASGVEAVETALQRGAKRTVMFARDDKWILPRNIVLDTTISAQPFGREMPLSVVWETLLKYTQYHGVEDLVPYNKGLYESTPVLNDVFLQHVRDGRCEYVRGDTLRFTKSGVLVRVRPRGSKSGDKGPDDQPFQEKDFAGPVVVLATGFHKPELDFLPEDLFPEGYGRPNLYLQNFSTEDWSVLTTNSSYQNAIGTVGHFHIGIYTRILLLLLLDKNARPRPEDMKLWVDFLRWVKQGARGGALGFFTYMELMIWCLTFHVFRPDRLRWIFFTMQGWGLGVKG